MVRLMGIVNLTPDSFWESSRVSASGFELEMRRMVDEGADIIDIGAISTRPGAGDVSADEEWRRLRPVLEGPARDCPVLISIDTTSAATIDKAVMALGKKVIVNDISAGEDDSGMLPLVGMMGLTYVAMHKRGRPGTMDGMTDYPDGVIQTVLRFFRDFEKKAAENGIFDWIADPGFGFAKTEAQNVELLENLPKLKALGREILVGVADKRFVRSHYGSNARPHSLSVQGGAGILRVHDIAATKIEIQGLC